MTSLDDRPADPAVGLAQEPVWPGPPGAPVVILTERLSDYEHAAFEEWLRRNRPHDAPVDVVHIPPAGRLDEQTRRTLNRHLEREDDPLFVPVGAVWSGVTESFSPAAAVRALAIGDPRRPRRGLQRWLARRPSAQCRLIIGDAATAHVIRQRFAVQVGDSEGDLLPGYVSRHATLALERAIQRQLGPQYKIPRLVRAEILASARYRQAVDAVAAKLDRPLAEVRADAETALDELVTGWGRVLVDFQAQLGRMVYRLGYDDEIEYDEKQVERVRAALATNAGVVLMSHRSHLDGVVLPVALAEHGLPRAHLLGGVNMAFFPFGLLMRRAGVIFIRREFREDLVYKTVLRQYVGYLVEKRFHLQWSIEGTRSRTGKMQPPKLGLLAYVVDALREGRAADAVLVPVSIAYDQIHEVGEFAAYAAGADKTPEGFTWALRWLQAQRRGYGKIYVRFADPISVRAELGDLSGPKDPNELHKLAFAVAWRMNSVTPIIGAALLTTVLLGVRGRALTLRQIRSTLNIPMSFARERDLPLAASARGLAGDEGIVAMLQALEKHGVVTCYAGGVERVWMIAPDHYHAASFYRNSLIHFFLDKALCELSLAHVAEHASDDPVQEFYEEAFRLRDLLKFDFFFPSREEFSAQIDAEMARQSTDWERRVKTGGANELLMESRLLVSSVMLASFIEAYAIVADVLQGTDGDIDERQLRKKALGIGRQYVLQRRVHSSESVSSLLFRTGVNLAGGRGLLSGQDLRERRVAFSWELRDVMRRVERVQRLAEARLSEMVDDH